VSTIAHADRFPPLPPERLQTWRQLYAMNAACFPGLVGIVLEEVRTDYARMRLPYRSEILQPGGVVQGGALATLMDTVVVPAIGSAYAEPKLLLTVDMHIQYFDAVAGEDAVAEGWMLLTTLVSLL
jgi:uncharacterized protein (TIGR00369 family)